MPILIIIAVCAVSFEIRKCESFDCVLSFQDSFGQSGILAHISINFIISLSIYKKEPARVLTGMALSLQIKLGCITTLTILDPNPWICFSFFFFLVNSLLLSYNKINFSSKKDSFASSLSICTPFIFFPCLNVLTRISSTILDGNDKSGYLVLFLIPGENFPVFHHYARCLLWVFIDALY